MIELNCQIMLKINNADPPGTSARYAKKDANVLKVTVPAMPAANINAFAYRDAFFMDEGSVCAEKNGRRSNMFLRTGI